MPFRIEKAKALRDTGKALLIEAPDIDGETWVPQSVIHEDSEVFDGDENSEGTLVVESWWARARGYE